MIHFRFCDSMQKPNLCMITDYFWFKENVGRLSKWCSDNSVDFHTQDPAMILFPNDETKVLFLLSWE